MLMLAFTFYAYEGFSQDDPPADETEVQEAEATEEAGTELPSEASEESAPEETEASKEVEGEAPKSFHQIIKQKFIEGGPEFMGITAICLVLGLALSIERILYLSFSTVNPKKLLENVEEALNAGGVDAALEVCRNTKGPIASIFYEGLSKAGQGIDKVEKAVISLGGVQMSQLEKGISWISLFIALAPMLGFMGTVIGMIGAFDAIQEAGDISPSLVAGGIKVALLTTVLGLIVAIILQIFYNYIIAKIDSLVGQMETATIEFVDVMISNNSTK